MKWETVQLVILITRKKNQASKLLSPCKCAWLYPKDQTFLKMQLQWQELCHWQEPARPRVRRGYSSVPVPRTFAGCWCPSSRGAVCKTLLLPLPSSDPETCPCSADPSSDKSGLWMTLSVSAIKQLLLNSPRSTFRQKQIPVPGKGGSAHPVTCDRNGGKQTAGEGDRRGRGRTREGETRRGWRREGGAETEDWARRGPGRGWESERRRGLTNIRAPERRSVVLIKAALGTRGTRLTSAAAGIRSARGQRDSGAAGSALSPQEPCVLCPRAGQSGAGAPEVESGLGDRGARQAGSGQREPRCPRAARIPGVGAGARGRAGAPGGRCPAVQPGRPAALRPGPRQPRGRPAFTCGLASPRGVQRPRARSPR